MFLNIIIANNFPIIAFNTELKEESILRCTNDSKNAGLKLSKDSYLYKLFRHLIKDIIRN